MAAKAQAIAAQGIGERLVQALRHRALSPDALADRLGIDVAALRDAIERDRLRADLVPVLARRLGVEPAWLLYGDEDGDAPAAPPVPTASTASVATTAAQDDGAEDDASCLTQADAVARVLRALPDGERGRALKLAVLDALDASTREDRVALPIAVRGLRRRVQDLAL